MVADWHIGTMLLVWQVGTMFLVVFAISMPISASLKTQTFTNTSQAAGSGASCTLADTDASACQDKDGILFNPVTNGDGSVQMLVFVFWSGQWGTVCDDVTECDARGGGTSPCSTSTSPEVSSRRQSCAGSSAWTRTEPRSTMPMGVAQGTRSTLTARATTSAAARARRRPLQIARGSTTAATTAGTARTWASYGSMPAQ
ncbi:unnamed protein product [Prorocentrum cordatum]|uniref:Uncharacterized protein n=1 Tax=Prorocentrum cordatum TaxID=2364126 RepID=A0ABN9SPJ2_9DINO|nr:unnamed protein product [Polarella glacialis]